MSCPAANLAASPTVRLPRVRVRLLLVGIAAAWGGGLAVGTPAAAYAWGARKAPSADNGARPKAKPLAKRTSARRPHGREGPVVARDQGAAAGAAAPAGGAQAAPAKAAGGVAAPLAARVDAAIGPPLRAKAAPALVREAVAARDLPAALRLAVAVEAARGVDAGTLVDVAAALGSGQALPVQLALWRRAAAARGLSPWLRDAVEEGLADALLTAGDSAGARAVMFAALRRRPPGGRAPIIERLVTWGRLAGQVDEVRDLLLSLRDPDAAIAAARQVAEFDGDEAGLRVLREAFRVFPGHRRLAAALLDALGRLGAREELAAVIGRVVALAPSEPMPWLRLVDAHIAMRDVTAASALIQRLAHQFARDDALLEALIDREQRIGDDEARVRGLYEALLRAAPRHGGYIEAYGEWLIVRSHGRLEEALAVLARLERLPAGPYEGRMRAAALLAAHGHAAEARGLLQELERAFPGRRPTKRALAELDGAARSRDAETHWLALCAIPPEADAELRRDIADARRSLLSLWRRTGQIGHRLRELAARALAGHATLADALLLFEGALAEELAAGDLLAGALLAEEGPVLTRLGEDSELRARVGAVAVARGDVRAALATARWLQPRDAEASRELALRACEVASSAGDPALLADAEALALGVAPEPMVLLTLGDLRLRAGDRVGASALYRRASALSPRDTRATVRLARLFREDGRVAEEAETLRAVVVRSADSDELEAAGQRLLTLAIARGEAAALLRWLDAVTPQHPRREVIERFRLLAYDVWHRTEPFERRLRGAAVGVEVAAPAIGTDALLRGDLALRVRSLRQLAALRRPIALQVARALLADPSAVVRREALQALAAIGNPTAIAALLEAAPERSPQVQLVLLAAFGRLPAVPAAVPSLLAGLALRHTELASVAALALGHIADAATLEPLLTALDTRRELRVPLLLAVGAVVAAARDAPAADLAVRALVTAATPEPDLDREIGLPMAAAAMWGLAATGRADARAALLTAAAFADGPTLRWCGLRLLARAAPPLLEGSAFDVELEHPSAVQIAIMGRLLHDLLDADPAQERAAMQQLDESLATALASQPAAARGPFCADPLVREAAGPSVRAVCFDRDAERGSDAVAAPVAVPAAPSAAAAP